MLRLERRIPHEDHRRISRLVAAGPDRQLPFRERLTGLAAAAFRALKASKWSADSVADLSNDEFFDLLGIPELTNATAAHAKGLPGPLIAKRDGCHVWKPEAFLPEDLRHGWTWDDCWNDAVELLDGEQAVRDHLSGGISVDQGEVPDLFMRQLDYKPQTTFQFDHPRTDTGGPTPAELIPVESQERSPIGEDSPFPLIQSVASPQEESPADEDADHSSAEESPDTPFQLVGTHEPGGSTKKAKEKSASTTDRHVAVIVRMIEAHRTASKMDTLGSVKAEKIAHLVEGHLGVDLGRNPVRDAAGPVDFPHFKGLVCSRAKKTFAFDTKSRRGKEGAIFIPSNGFNKALARSATLLADRLREIDALIGRFVGLKSEHAEAVATLFACWNDFLADGLDVNDDRIIADFYAWDESKTSFRFEDLVSTLAWMRRIGLVPTGRAKKTPARPGISQ